MYDNTPQYAPPTNEMMKYFLTLDNTNQMKAPMHLPKNVINELSLAFIGDERTGFFSAAEGSFDIVSLGYICASFSNSYFSVRNRYGGEININLGLTDTNVYDFSFPSESDTLVGEKAFSFTKTNNEVSTINPGMVVKLDAPGGVLLAQADVTANYGIGLMKAATSASADGEVQFFGKFYLADWTNVTGGTDLTEGSKYYLSDVDPRKNNNYSTYKPAINWDCSNN